MEKLARAVSQEPFLYLDPASVLLVLQDLGHLLRKPVVFPVHLDRLVQLEFALLLQLVILLVQ